MADVSSTCLAIRAAVMLSLTIVSMAVFLLSYAFDCTLVPTDFHRTVQKMDDQHSCY